MAILILNIFPAHMIEFDTWFADLNEDLYMFTDERHVKDFHNYSVVKGFEKYSNNDLVEVEALRLFSEKPFRTIIALAETDILRAGRIRDKLNIPGQSLESSFAFRDKVMMKTIAKTNGIPCAKFSKIDTPLELYDFVEKNGLPIVIKPRDGAGSANVQIISTKEQLDRFYTLGVPKGYMVESYVEGVMYEIDGLILNNNFKFCSVGKYHSSMLDYQKNMGVFTEILSPEDNMHQRLRSFFLNNILPFYPFPQNTTFHCEVFHTLDDQLLLCEIACRSPGGRITECIRQSYEINLDEVCAKAQVGIPISIPEIAVMKVHTGSLMIPKNIGRLTKMVDKFPFPWVTEYQPRVKVGYENHSNMVNTIDIIGSVVFEGNNEMELLDRFQKLQEYIGQRTTWEMLEN
ncbi:hypothetical protein P4H70_06635 [Paenibacillus ehimensis]|uniref:ATP-grasp domain-containing protein n=1 Tax=Paenibacillus ehimensis TaxID=79264 RepID=UPI002C4DBA69|nr:hypothetical protein [Paenibacillus ehimensis]MEC0208624.1 hypothetical protein [Paenibacillus ehimensis]HWO95580.1 hypothetical protein [Bacillus sp. (in: firmicutes)]